MNRECFVTERHEEVEVNVGEVVKTIINHVEQRGDKELLAAVFLALLEHRRELAQFATLDVAEQEILTQIYSSTFKDAKKVGKLRKVLSFKRNGAIEQESREAALSALEDVKVKLHGERFAAIGQLLSSDQEAMTLISNKLSQYLQTGYSEEELRDGLSKLERIVGRIG